jgi:hypothetical protein
LGQTVSVSTVYDLTAANAALKELYNGQVIENEVYADNPWLAMVQKKTDFGGKNMPLPVVTSVPQGRSAVFATAQANQTAASATSFALTRARDYQVSQIDRETMLASATDKYAFLEGAKFVIDGALQAITLSLASAIFRGGTGSIGAIATGGITSGVITLSSAGDVVNFEINQTLRVSATDGAAVRTAKGYVIAVNRTAGTVTVASSGLGGSAASPTAWAAGDFISVDGDLNAKIKGLQAWLPATAPTSGDNFFGVDRSADVTRLAGVRYDGSGQSIEEALIDGSMLVAREGGRPDICIMPYASYGALEKSLGSKAQYVDFKGPAELMFRGIQINGANSQIKVFPDRSCPAATAFLLTSKSWKLYSLGDAPHIVDDSGTGEWLRVSNADAAELRMAYYAQLGCNAPGWNGNITLGV